MKLIRCDNPFDPTKDKTEIELAGREELAAYLAEHQLATEKYALSLNGELLPPEKLGELALRSDDWIVVMPVLGNSTLKMVALLAVTAAAVVFGGPLGAFLFPSLAATAATTATALGTAIISIGGTLLVNAVASLFQKQPGGATYTFNGPQTTARSGIPIPKGYGTFAASPNIIQSWVDLQHADQDLHDADDGASDIGRQWLNIIACFGFGPAVSLSDIRINGTDIASFTDVAYWVKLGTNSQAPVTASDPGWTILNQTTTGSAPNTAPTADFNRIVNNYPQSQRIRCDIAQNYVIVAGQRNDTQRLDITVQFPRGVWRYDANQVIKRLDIAYDVYYKLHSASTWTLGQHHVYTNIRQGTLRQITTIDNLPAGQYDVKVVKIGSGAHNNPIYSVEHESDFFGDELWLESVQETCYDALAYPNMILLGLRIMASDQIAGANIQIQATVTYDLRVTLPAALSGYSHDNPALVAYDVLTDPLVGGGLASSNINLPAFQEWAALCDTLVPNDLSGTQKLAVFNGVFEEASKTIWDSFATIGVMSRAIPTRIGTQVGVMLDQPDTPVQLFSVGNIFKDSYSKDYLPIEDRANEVEVDYANADDDYKTRNPIRVIPQEELSSGYAIKKTRVDLRGCTNAVQAYYWAYHKLLENQLLLRTHKWDSPAQAIVCRVGNLVLLQHDVPQYANGGLIVGGTASNPILDDTYELDPAQTYTLTVSYPAFLRLATTITAITVSAGVTTVSVSGYTGTDKVTRLVDGTVDAQVTSYSAGAVVVADATGLTVGDTVSLYDTEVIEAATVNVAATAALTGSTVGAKGAISMTSSCGICNWAWYAQFSGFSAPALPGDAVVTGIYAVIVGSGGSHPADLVAGPTITPTAISATGGPADVTIPYGSGELLSPSMGTSLAAISTYKIAARFFSTLGASGLNYQFSISNIALAVYYTSATAPTTTPPLSNPKPTAAGEYVAWSLPTVAAAGSADAGANNGAASASITTKASTLVVASLPAAPPPDAPYILSSTTSSPKTVRIRSIKRSGEQKFSITAIDYDPGVYTIPTPVDLSSVASGGSAGNSASTPDPTTTPPPAPPTGVVNPGDPGYGGSSIPSGLGSYTQSPVIALSQPSSTSIALAAVTTTFSDHTATYGPQTFTIADPGSTPTWYYVTVDPTTLAYYCEASTAKVGDGVHVYLGSLLATHLGGAHSAANPGGWPIPSTVQAVS